MHNRQSWCSDNRNGAIAFTAAAPVEPLNTRIDLPVPPAVHTVIATDGSPIAPNHHEIAYCYLLNVGRVVLHYGQNRQPLLDSLPVFYRFEDLYISRRWGFTEEWMGYRRTASEATVLAELALPKSGANLSNGRRFVSILVSGAATNEARDTSPLILDAWSHLRDSGIPQGYLSASRSSEALNFCLQACHKVQTV